MKSKATVLQNLSSGLPAAALFFGLLVALSLVVAQVLPAQTEVPSNQGQIHVGKNLFRGYCKSCHGPEGEGDGPIANSLSTPPTDLTTLASQNGGEYPFELVVKIIDGREPVPGHTTKADMPTWGDAFSKVENGGEADVKQRIEALAHYLGSIQKAAAAHSEGS